MSERKIKYKQTTNKAKNSQQPPGEVKGLTALDAGLGDIGRFLDDAGPSLPVGPTAAGRWGHGGSEGQVWERGPGAVERHRTALLFDGDLEIDHIRCVSTKCCYTVSNRLLNMPENYTANS